MNNEHQILKNNIAAVVITYNRLDLLKEVLESVGRQTLKPAKIIVINNGSTDGTKEWLASQSDLHVIVQENTGSSGGQYTGIKTAYDLGFDWIWTMDDDVIHTPHCLEKLFENILLALNDMKLYDKIRQSKYRY